MDLKNVGQQLIDQDLNVLPLVRMTSLEFKIRFKVFLESLWELPTPSCTFHYYQKKTFYGKTEHFPLWDVFLPQCIPEVYPLRLGYAPIICDELNNESGYLQELSYPMNSFPSNGLSSNVMQESGD